MGNFLRSKHTFLDLLYKTGRHGRRIVTYLCFKYNRIGPVVFASMRWKASLVQIARAHWLALQILTLATRVRTFID